MNHIKKKTIVAKDINTSSIEIVEKNHAVLKVMREMAKLSTVHSC